MTLRIPSERTVHRLISTSTDEVVAWFPVPTDGRWNGGVVDLHMVGPATALTKMVFFGISAYMITLQEPENVDASPDTVWNNYVPKDAGFTVEDALDMDLSSGSGATIEVGPSSPNVLLDVFPLVSELGRKLVPVSFASSPTGFIDTATDTYYPTFRGKFRYAAPRVARSPSVVLVAVTSPTLTVPTSFAGEDSLWAPTTDQNWMTLRYAESQLEFAMSYLTGSVEAGANTPYEEISELLGRQMEQAYEDVNGMFTAVAWDAYAFSHGSVTVPGRFKASIRRN